MNEKIPEALAVLDLIISVYLDGNGAIEDQKAARKARAAFAKLIEAAKMANGDHSAPHDCYATGPLTGDPVMDLVVCPGCRLAAAITAVENLP